MARNGGCIEVLSEPFAWGFFLPFTEAMSILEIEGRRIKWGLFLKKSRWKTA